jgi:hypothetical protein
MTADVDVTVSVPESSRAALLQAIERAGFVARVPNLLAFAARTRVVPFVHRATMLPLDLVFAGDALEESFLERSQRIDLGGASVPVISPEDLVITKILAGRSKDDEDVRGILRRHAELDLGYLRGWLTELDALLERADLAPKLETLLKEVRAGAAPR